MLRSAGLTLFARLITAVLNFLAIILISRYLGPAERGICGWYLVIVATTLVFSELVAGPAAGFLLRKYPAGMLRRISYLWAVIPVLIINTLFLVLHKINFQEWVMLLVLCWLNAANTIHLHLLLARQRYLLFNTLTIFIAAISFLLILLLFWWGNASGIYYLLALILAWGIAFLAGLFYFNKQDETKEKANGYAQLLREGFRFGLSNQAAHLASLLNSRLMFFLMPASLLGVYSNALSLGEAMMMIPGSMGQILYASALNDRDRNKSAVTASTVWWITLIILGVCFASILIIPDGFYQFIFGNEFEGVKSYLLILAFGLIFYGCYLVLSYWQSAKGKFINNFYATSAGLLVNTISSIMLLVNGKLTPGTGAVCLVMGFLVVFFVSVFQFVRDEHLSKRLFSLPSIGHIKDLLGKS